MFFRPLAPAEGVMPDIGGGEGGPVHEVSEERLTTLHWANLNVGEDAYYAGMPLHDFQLLCARVTKLELFMFSLSDPKHLRDYPNLQELNLHLQTLPGKVSFSGMHVLQKLCVTECGLTTMAGVTNCPQLTHLDLSHNAITRIEPAVFMKLPRLKTLWLNENRIRRIEGLEPLTNLKTLWMAKNQLTGIYDSLEKTVALEELNLAGNKIGHFKDIPALARMDKLTSLAFSEPHFGENPVCALCNYSTYCLFHLQQLKVLDANNIADEARQLAEATFMKKKMYYNMRIKTLKRNTSNVIRKAMEARQTKTSQTNLNLNVLLRQKKDVEREIHESLLVLSNASAKDTSNSQAAEELAQLHRKDKVLQDGIDQKTAELEQVEQHANEFKEGVCETSQTSIARLMCELETGGNIRLEDGKPTDVWFTSCVDLVNSRFVLADFADTDVTGIRVLRVTRIHNRHLRNRFEERLEAMVNINDTGYKRSLEYLFFGEPASMPGEVARAMEDGFRSPEQYLANEGHGAVPLSNSVALCDLARLRRDLEELGTLTQAGQSRGALCTKLLITKVFLARCAQEKQPKLPGEPRAPIRAAEYEGFSSVYRIVGNDNKQRRWFVFEPALVLPEYLVEVEYLHKSVRLEREPSPAQLKELGAGIGSAHSSEVEASDLSNLTRPLLRFVQHCALASAADPYDDVCTAALNMPPPLPQRDKVERIMEEALRGQATGGRPLSAIEQVNLHGNSIRKIECLNKLSSLRVLILCFNEIHKIEGLDELKKLERLELGFNLIKRIEGLKYLGALKVLELNNNLIYKIEDVTVLRKSVPQLEVLTLRNNAICDVKSYRTHVTRRHGL